MQMSARCLRDGKRVTNDVNPSPIAVAFPCVQVHHDTVNNLHVIHKRCVHYIRVQHDFDFYATECWIRVYVHSRLLLHHSRICGGGLCQCFLQMSSFLSE